jgi:hypothetical protein
MVAGPADTWLVKAGRDAAEAPCMGALVVGLLVWVAVLGLAPATLYRLTPGPMRTNTAWGVGGWPLLSLMVAAPVVLMIWWGISVQAAGVAGSGAAIPLLFGAVMGLPVSGVSLRAWRTQRVLVDGLAPSIDLGLRAPAVPAQAVTTPTTTHRPSHPPDRAVRANQLLRRSRTVAIAAAVSLYALARVWQSKQLLHGSDSDDPPRIVLVLLLGCVFAACVLTLVLRAGHWRRGRGSSVGDLARERGWSTHSNDSGQLAARFPLLPLLRSTGSGDAQSTRKVVWSITGERRWWAVDQAGTVRDARGLRRSMRRSTVVVLLPGAALPRMVIAGRDLLRVREWLADSMLLESDQWNQRLWVWCPPQAARYAHAVLHPQAMEHLLASLPDGMALVIAGDSLAVWRDDPMIAPDLEAALHCVLGMADSLPSFVLTENASRA